MATEPSEVTPYINLDAFHPDTLAQLLATLEVASPRETMPEDPREPDGDQRPETDSEWLDRLYWHTFVSPAVKGPLEDEAARSVPEPQRRPP